MSVWQAKKAKGNEVASMPQEAVTKPDENSLPTPPSDQAGTTDGSKTDAATHKTEGQVQRRYRKRHAVPVEKPPEGGIMTELDQIKYAFVPSCCQKLIESSYHVLDVFNLTFPKLFSGWGRGVRVFILLIFTPSEYYFFSLKFPL